jgi:hypothetical protein
MEGRAQAGRLLRTVFTKLAALGLDLGIGQALGLVDVEMPERLTRRPRVCGVH